MILLFNYADKSETSVQNRLTSAREQIIAKSKDNNEFNVSKCGIIKKPSTCQCKQHKIIFVLLLFLNINWKNTILNNL